MNTSLFDGEPSKPKRAKPRKLKVPIGPFETVCTEFDRGTRTIILERITPHGLVYRLRGQTDERFVSHGAAFLRAMCSAAGFDAGPRHGTRIIRGQKGGQPS